MLVTIRRALLSVSDKTGLVDFARALSHRNVELLSTGGTARALRDAGLAVIDVSAYTGFPEIMDGRVKTLHPRVHGGLLGRRGVDDAVMAKHDIPPIDLLVVNLYPFAQTVAKPDCTYADAIENIDIGGPAMVRAASKNHESVTVVVDPADYGQVLGELDANDGATSIDTRSSLAAKAFAHTAKYDTMVSSYLLGRESDDAASFPATLPLVYEKIQDLRYGENPHQKAAFYRELGLTGTCVASATMLQGKELSFNNIADTDTAVECVRVFNEPACVIVKHANPCGVATGVSLADAYDRAYRTDPTSAFGGIIAFNRELDAETATAITGRQFVEVIAAPSVSAEATAVLAGKANVRVLVLGALAKKTPTELEYRSVVGGLLVQSRDTALAQPDTFKIVSEKRPTPTQYADLWFAWRVCKYVKSNAIVFARDGMTIGVGAGQMSRVYSTHVAALKAKDEGLEVEGSSMASDAFFPFRDGIDAAAKYGIKAIVQPGGSKRDDEVIAAANEHGMTMVFTGMRHFPALSTAMKILIVGSGGREHALAWKCAQSPKVSEVLVAPGNGGTATEPRVRNVNVGAEDIAGLVALAKAEKVGLTIIGPEGPLVIGVVDAFAAAGLRCFGPRKAAAQLEGSKAFTKEFLKRHGIPTAAYATFTRETFDPDWVRKQRTPIVVKASGLAAGKGVVIVDTAEEAIAQAQSMFGGQFGSAGDQVVIEEFLPGEEASFIVIADGKNIVTMATSQDHKRLRDADAGPNTGGMGAYSPAPVVDRAMHERIMREVIEPSIRGLAKDGTPYTGFLYAGIMVHPDGTPNVLEYNCRFGDPETQPIMMRLKSDLVELCEAALDHRLDTVHAEWDSRAALGVVLAAEGYPDTVRKGDEIAGLAAAAKLPGKVFHAGTKAEGGKVITHGGRVLCAVGLGDSVSAAQKQAYGLVDAIGWQGMQCRRDIGYRAIERERAAKPTRS